MSKTHENHAGAIETARWIPDWRQPTTRLAAYAKRPTTLQISVQRLTKTRTRGAARHVLEPAVDAIGIVRMRVLRCCGCQSGSRLSDARAVMRDREGA